MQSYAIGPELPLMEKTIGQPLVESAARNPGGMAVISRHQGLRISYAELREQADVYVVGLPDEKLGETVLAWIKLKAGAGMTEDEVREFCRGKIAHFKVPQYVRFVDAFPMTVTGKIQKFRIREHEIEAREVEEAAKIRTA